jgi:hypothetical protein
VKLLGNSTGIVFETVERHLSILAAFDEIAVGITHVATLFPAVIVQRLSEEESSLVAPLFVAGPDVGDAEVKKAIHSIEIRRGFEEDSWLVGSRAAAGIENDPGVSQLDVARIFRRSLSPKDSDVEVLRFFLILDG